MSITTSQPKAPAAAPHGGLLRILGIGFGLAVILGSTIGAGILRTPGDIARWLPVPWIYLGVWVLGGLYALLGACSMSELGAMMPRSGGYYVFARRALGEFPAFVVGWTDFLAQCGSTAAVAIVVGEYLGELFPALKGALPIAGFALEKKVLLASLTAIAVAVPQWRGIKAGSQMQNITSAAKALAFVGLIAAILILAPQAAQTSRPEIVHQAGFAAALILAMQAVIYTYDGWYSVIYFGEEVKRPGHDAPRAMFGGVLAVMVLYVLLNLALVYALPLSQIAGDQMPAGKAAAIVFGARGDIFIRVLMIVSMISAINAYHLMASRIPYAMATDGLLTRRAAAVNRGGTPSALLISVVVSVAFILTGSFERVIALNAFFFVADYALAYAAVFILRRREPETERPYRAWGYPWTTALALMGSLAFLAGAVLSDTRNSVYSLAVLAASYPLYKLFGVAKNKTTAS